MKKQKVSLKNLKVKSFTTSVQQHIQGGFSPISVGTLILEECEFPDPPDEPTGYGDSCEWTMCPIADCHDA